MIQWQNDLLAILTAIYTHFTNFPQWGWIVKSDREVFLCGRKSPMIRLRTTICIVSYSIQKAWKPNEAFECIFMPMFLFVQILWQPMNLKREVTSKEGE